MEDDTTQKITNDFRPLRCMLSEDELRAVGDEVARLVQEKDKLEADKKALMSSFKAKIDAADAAISEQSNKIRNKYEYRTVECEVIQDFKSLRVRVIRKDTQDILEERLMNAAELESKTLFDE